MIKNNFASLSNNKRLGSHPIPSHPIKHVYFKTTTKTISQFGDFLLSRQFFLQKVD